MNFILNNAVLILKTISWDLDLLRSLKIVINIGLFTEADGDGMKIRKIVRCGKGLFTLKKSNQREKFLRKF